MPLYLWLFVAVMTGWSGFQLWRANTLGKINAGVIDFDRATMPFAFWSQVAFYIIGFVMFGGGAIFIAVRLAG
jgi:hypothetical protein